VNYGELFITVYNIAALINCHCGLSIAVVIIVIAFVSSFALSFLYCLKFVATLIL